MCIDSTRQHLAKLSRFRRIGPITYWRQAGERANERSAHAEAEAHLTKGLEMLKALPETPERAQHELALHLNLGPALMATRGHHSEDIEQIYTRARELCQLVGETPQLFAALAGLHRFYYVRGALHTARELGEQFLALAKRQEDPALLLTGHWMMGPPLLWLGEMATAHAHFEQTIAVFDLSQHRGLAVRYGVDPGSASRVFTAFSLWTLGYPDQALRWSQEALVTAQELAHSLSQAYVLFCVALFHWLSRDEQSASQHVEACISLATDHGFPIWILAGRWLRGAILARQGHLDEGIAQLREGLDKLRATKTELLVPMILIALADTYAKAGRPELGRDLLADAQHIIGKTAQHFWESEMYRLQGECMLAQSMIDSLETETYFRQALDIARRQQAKSFELQAALSLAKLWQSQDKCQDAYDLLAPVYEWFTEGFDTADLKDAKSLLDELSTDKGASRWPE